jgi:hypothetical protein
VKKNTEMMDQWDNINNIEDCVALVTGARIKIGYPNTPPLFPYLHVLRWQTRKE